MKKHTSLLALLLALLLLAACQTKTEPEYTKYNDSFFDTFNTLTQVVAFTKTEQEFNTYYAAIHTRFQELHKLYDIYNNYDGVNNIKTINDNAGIQPVTVDREIIDLILFAKDWYQRTGGKTNIALGAVLQIWHDYRTEGFDNPENAQLPPIEQLREAAKYTDIDNIIVDIENSTVFLTDKKMSLDVGALAKGFATEIVAKEITEAGFVSGVISAGGNIRVIGKPLDGIRERWSIGIQDPDRSIVSEQGIMDTIFIENTSVVSSGDYQRYYIVDGKVIHHLIDSETLMPAEYVRSVTVVAPDSGVADFMSTALFLLPYEESFTLAENTEDVEALWVMHDGTVKATNDMKKIMKSQGATNNKQQ